MKHLFRRALACLFFAALLLLSACAGGGIVSSSPVPSDGNGGGEVTSFSSFTLPYNSRDTLNPYSSASQANLTLSPLLYDGLFELDNTFAPLPVLCDSYSAAAGSVSFTFHIRQGVKFSDGSTLTAADVVYSLNLAKASPLYGERLARVSSVTAPDSAAVAVTLSAPDGGFPALLDFPILKEGTGENSCPAGTGPYSYSSETGGAALQARSDWWRGKKLPVSKFLLLSVQNNDILVQAYNSREVNLVTTDLTGTQTLAFSGSSDTVDYPTTTLQYIGFNSTKGIFADAGVRRAFGMGIDRNTIVSGLLSGHAAASVLPVPPASALYDYTVAGSYVYSAGGFLTAMEDAGYTDQNGDGIVDLGPDGHSLSLSADLIVNTDNTFKISIAKSLAASFSRLGISLNVRELPWEEYTKALSKGDFDLYLGEVRLTADFNLTPLAGTGGALNYGKFSDPSLDNLLSAFSAATAGTRGMVASSLLIRFCQQAPLIPICFKSGSLLTPHGLVSGMTPTRQNAFYNLPDWTVALSS